MRFGKLAAAAGIMAMVACGGEKTDTTKTTTAAPATTPAAGAAAAGGAPITGATQVVQMVGDANGTRFEPNKVTLKAGDGIRFDAVSMGPHNVAFDPAKLSADAKAVLVKNMPNQDMGELSSKTINNGESYTLSFAGVPAGTYEIICTPHAATGMKMTVTVQ
ncbi:MAG TPA: plastocyanin/azurin family copper-binding protein [Gemmatimonadaceae bacterium]|nr:plastocyanin/azurin family copper-binding protein [Gemmatimonadaceae bacterium]